MKIVFDNLIYSWQRCGGISVVWSNLIEKLMHMTKDVEFLEYEGAENFNLSRKTLSLPKDKIHVLSRKWFKLKRYMDPSYTCSDKFIFHSSYYRVCNDSNAINITTVHDFAYELFEKNPIIKFMHCRQKHRAIRKSDHIVCISENTRKDLLRFLPEINQDKISVIYNGVDGKFKRIESAEQKDYALFVGKRDRYKNFKSLVPPLAQLGRKLKIVGVPLTKEEICIMESESLNYEYCGMVSDKELNKLYSEAFCLLYTSSYEGFGLPVLEAQMAGCPVIALNASSIPEVIGNRSLLIDCITKEQLEEKLNMLKDEKLRQTIIAEGIANAERFSWDKMADEYYALYANLQNE